MILPNRLKIVFGTEREREGSQILVIPKESQFSSNFDYL